ncbi:ParB/RepB/Spo0J family partition protein, partial [Candidatus Bathyarchaeota archaeon]|nr:ParB/RepB/Spo0J family partition protein [Candidatus Bathyarchaeota archaeon]
MNMRMTYAEIPADSVVYDPETGLFPFSSRKEVDKDHVYRIAQSIEETGYWSPILVRAETMQGLAGNHRFLALLHLAEKSGTPLETLKVPALLVECDEGEAVAIGLLENEMRKQLTQWELVKAILRVSSKRGEAVERLYRLDGKTVEQLRFWPDGLDHDAEEEAIKRSARARLPSEWWRVIQEQLADHDQLRATLQGRLRDPSWVIGRTLEDLNEEITLRLRASGIRFETGKT